jgi:hypothetical protein
MPEDDNPTFIMNDYARRTRMPAQSICIPRWLSSSAGKSST